MDIVKFQGGLGNQLFQYGLYRKLLILGKCVKADTRCYQENKMESNRELELLLFQGVKLNIANKAQVLVKKNFVTKRKGFRERNIFFVQENMAGEYDPTMLARKCSYLEGYWQTEKYFKDIRNILLSELVFPEIQYGEQAIYESDISSSESVSIHIRRGDYLNHLDKYGNICTEEYYIKAIKCIQKNIKNPRFFVFSDDMKWSKHALGSYKQIQFVEHNSDVKSIYDMKLMSLCKHNIIANSSFSWWASWLNNNPNKIIIAPERWRNDCECQDIYCKEWMII